MEIGRRQAVAAMVAATASSSAACKPTPGAASRLGQSKQREEIVNAARTVMPTIYLPHGGGPWPFVDLGNMFSREEGDALAGYLKEIAAGLPERPKAMVVVSAHWEAPVPTVMTSPNPPMLYDYYGFPPESYRITWPAPGQPEVASRVRSLLEGAGFRTAEDAQRGFDHGTFVPLKLTYPNADMPTIQLSLEEGLDPARHLAIGRALAPLREEGILLVGSGMSYHNLRALMRHTVAQESVVFDDWLKRIAVGEQSARDQELVRWANAPGARQSHPREEHLLPLMVMAGAAGADRGHIPYSGKFGGANITAVHFDRAA
jgi:aromatic ring-opening dioxygenase catalytic subunit (LigB family)